MNYFTSLLHYIIIKLNIWCCKLHIFNYIILFTTSRHEFIVHHYCNGDSTVHFCGAIWTLMALRNTYFIFDLTICEANLGLCSFSFATSFNWYWKIRKWCRDDKVRLYLFSYAFYVLDSLNMCNTLFRTYKQYYHWHNWLIFYFQLCSELVSNWHLWFILQLVFNEPRIFHSYCDNTHH